MSVSLLQFYHGGLQRRRVPRIPRVLRELSISPSIPRAPRRPGQRRARGERAHQPLVRPKLRLITP